MSFSFPRQSRVRTRAEYARVFDCARRTSDPLLSLHWHAGEGPARLGLAVSRKVSPRAVVRNRIKRGLREQFRVLRPQLRGGDYVVVVRAGAAAVAPVQLRAAFVRVLNRAGALPAAALPGVAGGGTMPAAPLAAPPSSPHSSPTPDASGG